MKGRPADETKRILPSGHESWRHWSAKLIDALIDRGTMSFGDVFAWGRQRGKGQDFCRHLLAYSDDRITLLPGKLWCLKTREKRLLGEIRTTASRAGDMGRKTMQSVSEGEAAR